MSSVPTPQEMARDARWLLQAYDPTTAQVRLVAMDADAYQAASFLDDRMFDRPLDAHVVPWVTVEAGFLAAPRKDARWIFHIGHVGSTLVARLLGEIPDVLSIREPRFLRDIVPLPAAQRSGMCTAAQHAFSRTFAPGETALVKATSFVSEIAPELVPPGQRALFMYAAPRAYVASILAGENSVKELHALSASRTARMAARVTGLDGAERSDAHRAAAAWACEMTSLEAAAEAIPDRLIEWADFDAMLDDLAPALGRVAGFFGFAADSGRLRNIADGPLMRRYSKALEYDYTPTLRRELIEEAQMLHRRNIDDALAMLRVAAEKSPLLRRALERAGES